MTSTFARLLITSAAVLLAGASTACVDEARCDAALAGVTRVRAESAQQGAQIAWLHEWQLSMASRMASAASPDSEALKQKLAALEIENAALTERLARAERRLDEGHAVATGTPESAPAQGRTRRLDEVVPYDLTGFLTRPRPSSRREAQAPRRAPSRQLDETVPY